VLVTACQKHELPTGGESSTTSSSNNSNTVVSEDGFNVILGRPTASSVTASLLFDKNVDVYCEYGETTGSYTAKTTTFLASSGIPSLVVMDKLKGDARYFYRLRYRATGSTSDFAASNEYSFQTQRASGATFCFTVEADEHLYDKKGVLSIYQLCLANQALDKPDFMLSLGDTFGDDHYPAATSEQVKNLHAYYRPILGKICHSVPFFFCLGNHEGENNYYMAQTPPNNLAINETLWRKYYFPNPEPNGFYSGNTNNELYGMGNPENYYAWSWGDALFVVLDVYRYQNATTDKPEGWNWTLGNEQYLWLKNTLESSNAKYKFVFAHHVRGQGRGGVTNAKLFEWGGYEANGTNYTFTANRPGWAKPIHKLFVDNKVTIFFQGHDHVFAHEQMDGVTYQALPMPSDSTYQIGILANGSAYTSDVVGGTGHLKVTVSSTGVRVDFVQAYLLHDETSTIKNRQVAFSYVVK
jgi:phosphodiesterase/alkaline phosphatase D-like protein